MKGETCKYPYKAEPPCDFNPRTHEGCDDFQGYADRATKLISIHAPMKGATPTSVTDFPMIRISIHAPMKGATHVMDSPARVVPDFNPRTHEGCDNAGIGVQDFSADFNPRTHEGCDSLQINSVIACFSIIYIAN